LNDDDNNIQLAPDNDGGFFVVGMALIAQIALGVIVGGLTLTLLATAFFVWNSRQRNERLAIALFIAEAVIVVVLVVVVSQ
jgi:hypothetical protein